VEITIVCVGKIKEKYLKSGIEYYMQAIKKCLPISLVEIPDEKAPENLPKSMETQIKDKEGVALLHYIKEDMYVITLEILGKELTTEGLIKALKKAKQFNKEKLCFVIGGSLGLSDHVLKRSNLSISFSQMTFPHQLMRLILTEKLAEIAPYL
jgi:23S rRNA (pseudouridine1915-N3)-methyltransferase